MSLSSDEKPFIICNLAAPSQKFWELDIRWNPLELDKYVFKVFSEFVPVKNIF